MIENVLKHVETLNILLGNFKWLKRLNVNVMDEDFRGEYYHLMFGDAIEKMKLIPSGSVDLVLADTPFGTTKCSWDTPIPFDNMWEQIWRITKPNAAVLLFAQTPFDKVLGASMIKYLKYEWIWEKTQATGHLNAKKTPMKAHENILVFYKKLPIYNPQKTTGHVRKTSSAKSRAVCINRRNGTDTLYNNESADKVGDYSSTERYPRSVLTFPSDKQKSAIHKTQKPYALMEYFVKTYSNEGDTVCDFTMGYGNTVKASVNNKRFGIGIDNGFCSKSNHEYEGLSWCKIVNKELTKKKKIIIIYTVGIK